MPPKTKKRLGKKHRQAATRPKKGRNPKSAAVKSTGSASPKQRKELATKKAKAAKAARTPKRSPEFERKKTISTPPRVTRGDGRGMGGASNAEREEMQQEQEWRAAEAMAAQIAPATEEAADVKLPLIAVCGRPNVGKSTLFNRITGSRRSIVGDEPGITRDRIYGQIEWQGREARIVDTGGVVPGDDELIPAEIFRQAQVALEEADAIVMVVDGRTELASPDMELARLLLRGGKPVFLAVNKMDTSEMLPQAENFRRLGG